MTIHTVKWITRGSLPKVMSLSIGDLVRFNKPAELKVCEEEVVGFECSAHDPTSVSVVITKSGHKVYQEQIRAVKKAVQQIL